jgi:biotin operon repressor
MEQRAGKLSSIQELLKQRDDIVIRGTDALTARGYTQVPNSILMHAELSPGAKLTYAMLLRYAWQEDRSFPGQERLAKDVGAGERSIRTYLKELKAGGFVEIHQRGLGRSNLYVLDITVTKLNQSTSHHRSRPAKFAGLERQ